MSLRASMRRDQRRRLLASRQRDAVDADGPATDGGDSASGPAYDDEAHPERHPALATRLPVGAGRFFVVACGIVIVFSGAIAIAVSGPLFGRPLVAGSGRFARSLALIAAAFDPGGPVPVQVWLAEVALLTAAAVAGVVRLMRRHRRDDYKGRFRAWGWLAWLLGAAAWSGAGAVPLGAVVGMVLSEATGITLGPDGIGWWAAMSVVSFAIVVPWAVLPLRERGATATWMLLALTAWGVAVATPWAGGWLGGQPRAAIVGQAAWVAGAGLMLLAMMAAARSVIREVRGLCRPAAERRARRKAASAEPAATVDRVQEDEAADSDEGGDDTEDGYRRDDEDEDAGVAGDRSDTEFVDGGEGGNRRLSKAERKRLRKLARMNGHAA